MSILTELKIGARFKAVVTDSKTNQVRQETDWTDNLVLDAGLNRMSQGTWINRCCVGIGTTEPLATDTGLTNFLAASASLITRIAGHNTSGEVYYSYVRLTYRFDIGVAKGTVSEAGLGWNNANLWNKVILKDSNGNPSPIIVLDDDYLDVTAEIRTYINVLTPNGTINLLNKDGSVKSTHSYFVSPFFGQYYGSNPAFDFGVVGANAMMAGGSIVNSLTYPTDVFFNQTSMSSGEVTYLSNRSMQVNILSGLAQNNREHKTLGYGIGLGSQSYYSVQYNSGFLIELTPPIVKNNTQVLRHSIIVSWDRI